VEDFSEIGVQAVIDSLGDGLYVCDMNRRIIYWSKSAERITGWAAEDVVGRCCYDNVLNHIDKDGHRLCGEEFCPLHRAMVTDSKSKNSLLVYAKGKEGGRIPTLVSVVPLKKDDGTVIGGVETFQDASSLVHDLERAKAIQRLAVEQKLPEDDRLEFKMHYTPQGIIGGDYYAVKKLDADRYGIMLADVMGHGTAAALYTMHLSQLWDRFCHLLPNPTQFAQMINGELVKVVRTDESFATAICGIIDLDAKTFRYAGAGGPQIMLTHADGHAKTLESSGLPLGVLEDSTYDELETEIVPGDNLLLFSDGATEVFNADGDMLGVAGLANILKKQGYPDTPIRMEAVERELLRYSNAIRLEDDLTIINIRFC